MTAPRRLDELVAWHLFGWNQHDEDGTLIMPRNPSYSSTGDGAILVIEKMRERNLYLSVYPRPKMGVYEVAFDGWAEPNILTHGVGWARAATLPEAVALAALRALGVEVTA